MFPVLFRIPLPWGEDNYFPIRMFGVMVILGFLVGTWFVSRRLKRQGVMGPGRLRLLLLPARRRYPRLAGDVHPAELLRVPGALLPHLRDLGGRPRLVRRDAASTLFAFWWLWKRKLPVMVCADAAAIGVSIGLAIGRWGCFFAGDDYGRKILAPDGTRSSPLSTHPGTPCSSPSTARTGATRTARLRRASAPRSGCIPCRSTCRSDLIVFLALLFVARRTRRPGIVSAWYLLLYPVNRFIVEFWRGDATAAWTSGAPDSRSASVRHPDGAARDPRPQDISFKNPGSIDSFARLIGVCPSSR